MQVILYISGVIAVVATALMLTRLNAIHALLYLVVSLLAVAVVFYALGAPLAAALEVITYAGAIMVLLVFFEMLLNLGEEALRGEKNLFTPGIWIGPGVLAVILVGEFLYLAAQGSHGNAVPVVIGPKQVGIALYGPFLLGAELASMLLLAAAIGAYHLGWRKPSNESGQASGDGH